MLTAEDAQSMTTLIFFFVLSILFSFLCSVWEAVLLSITPSYITQKVHTGSPQGETLQKFKEDIDKPLSAILTLNTIAHTVGAIGVGAQAGKVFGTRSLNLGLFELSGEAIVASVMTIAILILSEIIPKTIGANYWKKLTPFTISSLKILLFLLGPFVWISQLITKNLKKDKSASVLSRADFRAITQAGYESGALKETESRTIGNILKLDQITVKTIMTPRSVMVSTVENVSLKDFYNKDMPLKYSRIPVFDTDKEQIRGILLKDDLFQGLIEQEGEQSVSNIMKEPVFITESENLTKLQNLLMETNNHIAVVTDEFGAVLGIATWEDLLETILGLEILDETDDVEDLQSYAKELWEKRKQTTRP